MKRFTAIFFLAILCGCSHRPLVVAKSAYFTHVVSSERENLDKISIWYTGSRNNSGLIAKVNPRLDGTNLAVGSVVQIPVELIKNSPPIPTRWTAASDTGASETAAVPPPAIAVSTKAASEVAPKSAALPIEVNANTARGRLDLSNANDSVVSTEVVSKSVELPVTPKEQAVLSEPPPIRLGYGTGDDSPRHRSKNRRAEATPKKSKPEKEAKRQAKEAITKTSKTDLARKASSSIREASGAVDRTSNGKSTRVPSANGATPSEPYEKQKLESPSANQDSIEKAKQEARASLEETKKLDERVKKALENLRRSIAAGNGHAVPGR